MTDKDLLGDAVAPTPPMTAPLGYKGWRVFRLNDCDWWIARTMDEAKADYRRLTGLPEDEAFEDARELTDEELDHLQFVDNWDAPKREHIVRTFRKELQRRVDAGLTATEMFASTEY